MHARVSRLIAKGKKTRNICFPRSLTLWQIFASLAHFLPLMLLLPPRTWSCGKSCAASRWSWGKEAAALLSSAVSLFFFAFARGRHNCDGRLTQPARHFANQTRGHLRSAEVVWRHAAVGSSPGSLNCLWRVA